MKIGNKIFVKGILVIFAFLLLSFYNFTVYGEWSSSDFVIIPNSKTWDSSISGMIHTISKSQGQVWSEYDKQYKNITGDIWAQFATWIFWWDSIILYIKYLIKFLSELGLVIWALMIIYAWYIYATWVFSGNASRGADAVKKAILWVVIIIGSFAIMKIVVSMFL